jgi:DNA modification methylase
MANPDGGMMDLNRVICGDCLEFMRELPDKCVDLIFTDPPYGHNNNNNGDLISRWEAALGRGDYQPDRDNKPIKNDGPEANELFKQVLPELYRVLVPGGCCCCCCGGGGGPNPQFGRWALWMNEVFEFKQMIVWDKGPMGMGWHYRRSYETVLVGQKRGAACKWYDESSMIENIIRPGQYGIAKIIPRADQHPTEKPWQLAAHFIRLHSQPDELILDPFCGSGSTGIAARRMGRNFIGIELDPVWAEVAQEKIEAESVGQTRDQFKAGQLSLLGE